MKYLIAYDISENKDRNKVIKLLKKYGIRTQYSVFECELNEKNANQLFNDCSKIINSESDLFFMFPLNKKVYDQIIRLGKVPNELKGVI